MGGCGSGQLTEGGAAASNFMRWQGCEEVALHQFLQSDQVRRCIRCGHGIEKNGGCDHITCRKEVGGCGAEFCWRCGADYNGPKGIRAIGNSAHEPTCAFYFPNPEED